MNKDKDEVILELKDYDYLVSGMADIISASIILIILYSLGANFQDTGLYSFTNGVIVLVAGITSFIIFKSIFFKDRKTLFYKDKIVFNRSKYIKVELDLIDIEEGHLLLTHNVNSNTKMKLYRWNTLRKVLFILAFPLLIPVMFILTIGRYISSFIVYRSLLLKRYRILLIGKTEKDYIVFDYTGDKQLEVEEYFKKILDNDIKVVEPSYWFYIPQY